MIYKKILTILLWTVRVTTLVASVIIFALVFNRYFVPLGKLEITYDFSEDSEYISHLGPWQRLLPPEESNGDWFQGIKDDLVYFDAQIPRWFQTAIAEITFQNPIVPIVEIGARINQAGDYLTKPLENKLIDSLAWSRIEANGIVLYQKNPKYADLQSFISAPPQNEIIGEYFYNFNLKKVIPDYKKSDKETVIDRNLRGSHTIYTYLKNEKLNFTINKFDLNRYAGSDILKVEVIKQVSGEKIYSGELSDDGIEGMTGVFQPEQSLSIVIPDLEEGVYRIEIMGNDDIVISELITAQHLLVFARNLFLVDNEEYFNDLIPGSKPTNLFAKASTITFKTSHPSGLQKISVDSQPLEINELNRNFKYLNDKGIIKITVPKNDLAINFDGFMAFSESQYFNPFPDNIIGIENNSNVNLLDYLIAEYSSPKNENGWRVKSNTFDLNRLYKDKNDFIRFRLSAPGLNETESVINVSKIKITYEKPPITLKNLPGKAINYIKKFITKN